MIKRFNPEIHYQEVVNWWKSQDWPPVPLDHLSANGLVSYSEDQPTLAAWLYKTDSSFCILEFLVANPEIRHERRANAFKSLLKFAKLLGEELGFKTMLVMVSNASLISRLEAEGFKTQDENMVHMTYNLAGGKDG